MKQDIPPNDPRSIWQSQGKEHSAMPVEEIRLRAFTMQTKVRRNLVVTMGFGSVLLILSAVAMTRMPNSMSKWITALVMLLILTLIYRAARIFRSSESLTQDAGLNACLDFYRRELTAQYRAAGGSWTTFTLEIVLFLLAVWVSIHAALRYDAARILLPALFGFGLLARFLKARKIKRELHQLDEFGKENN
jgi:hypothetical protein